MRVVDIVHPPAESRELVAFVEDISATTGQRPLSDHLWLDLRTGGTDGFVAVTVADESGILAMAQISAGNDSSSLEVVVHPDVADARAIHDDVAATAVDTFRAGGGGLLFWWVDDPTTDDRALAARFGLEPTRAIHEMRRPLPLDQHATIATRDFVVGADEDGWLAVNNRAFADHGEQGGWTRATLELRMSEPWFDAAGFRLHEIDGRIAAFCWTKLHHEADPVIGEIYVIAVDPEFHGRGLGKQLTLAGLDSISARGVTMAGLYVDTGNEAAVGLYERLGFDVHRTRQAYAAML